MPQLSNTSIGSRFKLNNDPFNKSPIVYNTRGRIKRKRFKRAGTATKNDQSRLNNQLSDSGSSDEENAVKAISKSKLSWKKTSLNNDFFTPLDIFNDQINPSLSYPLCILPKTIDQQPNQHPIIFVKSISLYNLMSGLLKQLSQITEGLFCDFDWEKISNTCGLSARACREIWWSIDESLIPILDGYLITLDMKYQTQFDPKMISYCRKRVKSFVNIALKYNIKC